jgi:hypothetical protein
VSLGEMGVKMPQPVLTRLREKKGKEKIGRVC